MCPVRRRGETQRGSEAGGVGRAPRQSFGSPRPHESTSTWRVAIRVPGPCRSSTRQRRRGTTGVLYWQWGGGGGHSLHVRDLRARTTCVRMCTCARAHPDGPPCTRPPSLGTTHARPCVAAPRLRNLAAVGDDDLHALGHGAEDDVLAVEPVRLDGAQEEL